MEFCTNCGSEVTGSEFCPECGTKVERETEAPVVEAVETEAPASNGNLVKIIIAAVVAVCVIVAGFIIFGNSAAEKKAIKNLKAYYTADAEKYLATFPEEYVEKIEENGEEYMGSDFDLEKKIEDNLEENQKNYDKEEDVDTKKIKYRVKDNDKFTKKELDDLIDNYDDNYELDLDIKEARQIEIEVQVPEGDSDAYEFDEEITMVKIGSKWYVLGGLYYY